MIVRELRPLSCKIQGSKLAVASESRTAPPGPTEQGSCDARSAYADYACAASPLCDPVSASTQGCVPCRKRARSPESGANRCEVARGEDFESRGAWRPIKWTCLDATAIPSSRSLFSSSEPSFIVAPFQRTGLSLLGIGRECATKGETYHFSRDAEHTVMCTTDLLVLIRSPERGHSGAAAMRRAARPRSRLEAVDSGTSSCGRRYGRRLDPPCSRSWALGAGEHGHDGAQHMSSVQLVLVCPPSRPWYDIAMHMLEKPRHARMRRSPGK